MHWKDPNCSMNRVFELKKYTNYKQELRLTEHRRNYN